MTSLQIFAILKGVKTSALLNFSHHCSILFDLFDTVNNDIFLSSLSGLGISGNTLSWFESYLIECFLFFFFFWHWQLSMCHDLKTGVPPESVLSPLFLTYISINFLRRNETKYDCQQPFFRKPEMND